MGQELGRGGSAIVLAAYDLRARREVALKFPNVFDAAESRLMIDSEIKALRALHHPALPELYGIGEGPQRPYLELERLSSVSLADCVAEVPLPTYAALDILDTLASGLDALHRAGFAHRDVKAENVLFRASYPVLVDLGLALGRDDPCDQCRTSVGTPMYLAPEVSRVEVRDLLGWQRADLYSFGVTAYYALTGQFPFEGPSSAAVVWAHLTRTPSPASLVQTTLPETIDPVLHRALAKDPAQRHPSSRALVHALRTALH